MHSRRSFLASAAAVPALMGSHAAAAPDATAEATAEMNVVYGEIGGYELLLDVFRPAGRESMRPAVILLYGTSFTSGYASRSQMNTAAADLASRGYVAFNVDYRLLTGESGVNHWPAQLDDVQRAVRWIRANAAAYGVDPERIASYGLSSGGQLAAMLGLRETRDNADESLSQFSSRVSCVVAVVGAYDMKVPFSMEDDNRVIRNLLGGTFEEVPAAYRDASPIDWVDQKSAPFLILQDSSDSDVLIAHAMVSALEDAALEVVYVEYPQANHFSWVDWSLSAPWTLTFLQLHLRPEV